MKAVEYEPKTGNVRVNEKVSIGDFAKYIAGIYSEAINNPKVTYGGISGLFRHNLPRNQADFGIGESIMGPDLIAMGSEIPSDTHNVIKYHTNGENFGKFIKKLEEICQT